MAILTVHHVTTYSYRQAVSFGEHRVMFRPRDSHDQRLLEARLLVTPEPSAVRWMHDVFGNCVALVRFDQRAAKLRFDCIICLDHRPVSADAFGMEDHPGSYPFAYDEDELPDLAGFIERQYSDPENEIASWARRFVTAGQPMPTWEMLSRMTQAIKREFKYVRRLEPGIQPPLTTLSLGSGSCRDFALFMMEAVRALGLAARFISGYLYVPRKPNPNRTRIGGGATHAWLEVYLPGAGWVEFDPTNGIVGNQDLIRVAVARDPKQATPISGTWMGVPGDVLGMAVEVNVIADEGSSNAPGSLPPYLLSRA